MEYSPGPTVIFFTSLSRRYFYSFPPSAFLWGEDPAQSCFNMFFSEGGRSLLCGLVVVSAKQSQRWNWILGSVSCSYCSSVSDLELPKRKNVYFGEKEGVGGLNVNVTVSRKKKIVSRVAESLGFGPNFTIHFTTVAWHAAAQFRKWNFHMRSCTKMFDRHQPQNGLIFHSNTGYAIH